jgi:hypothetical protein
LPAFIQAQVDQLVEKGKREGLTAREQADLDAVLDYVDDMTLLVLSHARPLKK